MNQNYRNCIKWALFSLLYLLVILAQTTLFGRLRPLGVKFCLMPVAVVCITMHTDHESGGLFGLAAGFFWYAFGADDGILSIVTFTLFGIAAGWLCGQLLARRVVSALLLCLGALLFHQIALFLLKFYLSGAPARLFWQAPLSAVLSVLGVPPIYLLAKWIGKAGDAP